MPEQVIPMGMRREAGHNGLAQIGQVLREAGHFVATHPGVDEQHASPPLHDNRVGMQELALVDQHTLRDLSQHGTLPLVVCNRLSRREK
jgi:thermostable 8-oxoguanine DNA glycosylase